MLEKEKLEMLFDEQGLRDYCWIQATDIEVARWARFKCMYGCKHYGKQGACPPGGAPSVDEIREFFNEYQDAVLFHFTTTHEKREDNHSWTRENNRRLLHLERAVFLAGYYKAFVLFMGSCYNCRECRGDRVSCHTPHLSRPSPESFAVDVFATVRKHGYPIEVLQNDQQSLHKYGILLIQ